MHPEYLDTNPYVLKDLCSGGKIELECPSKERGFPNIKALAETFRKYQIDSSTETCPSNGFPYMDLWRAFGANFNEIPELARKMKLLTSDLESCLENPENSPRKKDVIEFLVNFKKELESPPANIW